MSNNESYTKVPNHIQDWLMTADLNMTQFRIIHVIIRHTYGYHQQWSWLTSSYLSERTNCNVRQVKRELKKLIDRHVVIERYEDGKRLLRVNPRVTKTTN